MYLPLLLKKLVNLTCVDENCEIQPSLREKAREEGTSAVGKGNHEEKECPFARISQILPC
jgi:hypothetical protein